LKEKKWVRMATQREKGIVPLMETQMRRKKSTITNKILSLFCWGIEIHWNLSGSNPRIEGPRRREDLEDGKPALGAKFQQGYL